MNLKTWHITLLFILLTVSNLSSNDDYVRYKNKSYKYSILIPGNWKKSNIDLEYKHILILSKGTHTKIKITATQLDEKEKEKWETWKEWYIEGIGKKLTEIFETENVKIQKNVVGKLLIFDYISRNKKILQRIMISKFNDNLLVIECSSTLKYFYKYNELFNIVMGSLIFE